MSKNSVLLFGLALVASACGAEATQEVSAASPEPAAVVRVVPVAARATDDGGGGRQPRSRQPRPQRRTMF